MKVKKIGNEIRKSTRYSGAYGCHTWKADVLYDIYKDEDGNVYEKNMGDVSFVDEEDREDWIKGMCTT